MQAGIEKTLQLECIEPNKSHIRNGSSGRRQIYIYNDSQKRRKFTQAAPAEQTEEQVTRLISKKFNDQEIQKIDHTDKKNFKLA